MPDISPLSLLQEELRDEPWKLLVACILLNQTSFKQVRGVIWKLFDAYPTPCELACADKTELIALIRPLGFYNRRAATLKRFAKEFHEGNWIRVSELHGIGKYASDSYTIFVLGRMENVRPTDKKLKAYIAWAKGETNDPEDHIRQQARSVA